MENWRLFALSAFIAAVGVVSAQQRVVVAYVTSWTQTIPDPTVMTHINYAFGHVRETFDGVRIDNESRLRQIIALKAKNPRLKVLLSVGGWGSGRFSEMAASEKYRLAFAKNCRRVVDEYGLDGIDIDWEYPTQSSAGISSSPEDTRNFTLLMRDLRRCLDCHLLTCATVASGEYIDFHSCIQYIDMVNVMSYDMGNPPYHHSALYPSEITDRMTASSAIDAHLQAGVPREKLVMGMPLYGRGTEGYSAEPDSVRGVIERWHEQSMVPYLVDAQGRLVIGFENERSIGIKCQYISDHGLRGGMYWEYGDEHQEKLRSRICRILMHGEAGPYTADYAGKRARSRALFVWDPSAEPAHVEFDQQAIRFYQKLSYGEGYTYDTRTDCPTSLDTLRQYDVVVMLNALPQNVGARKAFEQYMEEGGGWLGFHATGYNDASTHWPWLNHFLGCGPFLANNWPPQPALVEVESRQSPVTRSLPHEFVAPASEFYQFSPSPRANKDVEVLVSVSPKNYPFGIKDIVTHGDFPIVWTNKRYRMVYLNMGHGDEAFIDATQNLLFTNAFRWVAFGGNAGAADAQTIWNKEHLKAVKANLEQPVYQTAYRHLKDEAERALQKPNQSVMMKEQTAASGDRHDYLSLSRYFWPDSTKTDGLPYVSRDGVSNPELESLDRQKLGEMADNVTTLSLAWYFSGDERYARKATEQLRVWFLNEETRMNPNLNYAQIVPGQNGDKGRCYGLIDSYSFVEMLDAVQLLEGSEAFTDEDQMALKTWFGRFLEWMLTSEQGREEQRQGNNHGVAYDAQVTAYARYARSRGRSRGQVHDRSCRANQATCPLDPERRMRAQIEPDGSQPRELSRTLGFGYSVYNLTHMIDLLQMAHKVSDPAARQTSHEGLTLCEKAADFLAQYIGKRVEQWPYQQISGWDEKQDELAKDLYRLYLLDPSRTDYLRLARTHLVKRFSDRFFLLYYTPDETDNAFAQADIQLRYQLELVDSIRQERNDTTLMPRCLERDGRLRMVDSGDWCCGFFAGELWQMYQYSHDPFWRTLADSNTWPIEPVKLDGGSHDLGFMVYNSFGKAYELTGRPAYRDVVVEAANTLASRYDERVGCIRSWSWGTPDRWQYAVIIDNMINLELLFVASELTGDERYRRMAVSHANTTMRNHFREDMTSYHVVDYNPEDGSVIKRITHQGLSDESVWSRGQGWGLYGFTMCYRYTRDQAYLEQARKIARCWLSLPDMPEDGIPYWDMRDPAIPDAPRDASAAAVIASALYELACYVAEGEAKTYRQAADKMLHSLETNYQPEPRTAQGFLLLHSTGNYPAHDEIDVPIIYADYYYLEAQIRRQLSTRHCQ